MDDSQDNDGAHETRPQPGRGDNLEAEEMGTLGQPISEPAPRGTFILLLFFLLALVASWLFVFLQIWDRGAS